MPTVNTKFSEVCWLLKAPDLQKKRSTFYHFILNALSFQVHGFASTIWTSWYLLYWASSPNWWALWLVLWGRGRQLLIWVERKYRYMGRLLVWQSQPTISRLVVNAGIIQRHLFIRDLGGHIPSCNKSTAVYHENWKLEFRFGKISVNAHLILLVMLWL